VLYHLCEALRVAAVLLNAYLPSTAPKMMEQLGLDASALDLSKTVYGAQETYTVHKGDALFPRIDVAKEIAYLKEQDEKRKAAAAAANKAKEEAAKPAAPKEDAAESNVDFTHEEEIDFDTSCSRSCAWREGGAAVVRTETVRKERKDERKGTSSSLPYRTYVRFRTGYGGGPTDGVASTPSVPYRTSYVRYVTVTVTVTR